MAKRNVIPKGNYIDEVDSWYQAFEQNLIPHIEMVMKDIVWVLVHNDLPRGVPLTLFQMYDKLADIKKAILKTET